MGIDEGMIFAVRLLLAGPFRVLRGARLVFARVFVNPNAKPAKSGLEWAFSADQFKPMPPDGYTLTLIRLMQGVVPLPSAPAIRPSVWPSRGRFLNLHRFG
ncbi:MAG: hypothetical protein WA909_11175 [Castellaniella sp.]|uniref:hypothetical protein n=1 Tax=Castellaniella sp. TaxID=1955812 RepID=UPI003C7137D6